MSEIKKRIEAEQEDLQFGQSVIVTARWILVASGLFLALWNPGELGDLRVQIILILLLAVANFYLHAQILMGKSAFAPLVYGASLADLAVVTILVLIGGGLEAEAYVFYFPAILGFSVAFPPMMTLLYGGSVIGIYGLIGTASFLFGAGDMQVLATRLIMLAAVATCGVVYWRIERNRRQQAIRARKHVISQVRPFAEQPSPTQGV